MKKEIKSALKKTAKIAGVTCVAAGAVAVMTSGVALKTIAEGGKYLVNTAKRIATGKDESEEVVEIAGEEAAEAAAEEIVEVVEAEDLSANQEPIE